MKKQNSAAFSIFVIIAIILAYYHSLKLFKDMKDKIEKNTLNISHLKFYFCE